MSPNEETFVSSAKEALEKIRDDAARQASLLVEFQIAMYAILYTAEEGLACLERESTQARDRIAELEVGLSSLLVELPKAVQDLIGLVDPVSYSYAVKKAWELLAREETP